MTLRPFVQTPTLILLAVVVLSLCIAGYILATREKQLRPAGKENPVITWIRRFLISALMVFTLAGPAIQAEEIEVNSNIEIVFAIDRTGSMAAEDLSDGRTRIDAVKDDISALLDATAGSRYAVVTWDSTTRVELPFTTDGSAARSLADVLHQEITEFSTGSSSTRPVNTLYDLLTSAAEQRPENIRYLIVMSDGESTDSNATYEASWSELAPLIDGGAVLGYGTEQGGPMRVFVPGQGLSGTTEQYMTDPSAPAGAPTNEAGEPLAISRIDADSLKQISDELGLELLINPSGSEIATLGSGLMDQAESLPDRTGTRHRYRYVTWIPAVVIALLLVWEVTSDAKELSRMRRTGGI